jgi:hypothetical protein
VRVLLLLLPLLQMDDITVVVSYVTLPAAKL